MNTRVIAGLDVGTTKVCAAVGKHDGSGVTIAGIGTSPSTGMRKGVVTNIETTADAIRRAVKEAEASSGIRIKSVSVGISGGHIQCLNSSGAIGIRNKEVTSSDRERAIDAARTVYIPLDREVIHVIPGEFTLDNQEGLTDPVGMSGVRLQSRVHIITAAASSFQNLLKCCEKAGLAVEEVIFEPVASAHCTLTDDEKEFGSILIDIGGGTTDIAFFKDGRLSSASVIGVGGNHFTSDIAVGLKVGLPEAERIKKVSGAAYCSASEGSGDIEILQEGSEARTIPRVCVIEILQPRAEEVLEMIKKEIRTSAAYEAAACGVVLTGGASLLRGFNKMAEAALGLPVRLGGPRNIRGAKAAADNPLYATGIGLVTCSADAPADEVVHPDVLTGAFGKMKDRLKDIFRYADYLNVYNKREGGMACLKSRK
ncbi:MAG: cell division protein FtsA [Nitrospirae bacterium]|nr:cell division protein FtsA [Nitrospirota bacterium]